MSKCFKCEGKKLSCAPGSTNYLCPAHFEEPFLPKLAPTLRPYTSAERKDMPLQKVLAEYFPDAFMALARLSRKANEKHNPGEPMHWARGKSNDHLDCAARHLLTPDAVDPDTGEIELVAALWRCAAALQLAEEKRLVSAGIMPLSGVTGDVVTVRSSLKPGETRELS